MHGILSDLRSLKWNVRNSAGRVSSPSGCADISCPPRVMRCSSCFSDKAALTLIRLPYAHYREICRRTRSAPTYMPAYGLSHLRVKLNKQAAMRVSYVHTYICCHRVCYLLLLGRICTRSHPLFIAPAQEPFFHKPGKTVLLSLLRFKKCY